MVGDRVSLATWLRRVSDFVVLVGAEYLISFYMYDYIGGRFSCTSMVGGPMLAFGLGYDN